MIRSKALFSCCEKLEAACRLGDLPLITASVDSLHLFLEQLGEVLAHYNEGSGLHQ